MRFDLWTSRAFELSVLAFLPMLVFSRGLSARCIELGVLAWIVWELRNGFRRSWANPGLACLIAFAGSYALSSAFSIHPNSSFRDLLSLTHGLLFCFALHRMPLREGFWGRLGLASLLTLAGLAADVLTQHIFGTSLLSGNPLYKPGPNSEARVTGPFSNPNFLFVIPTLGCALWVLPRPSGNRRLPWAVSLIFLFGLAGWAALLSGSRNVFLACAALVAMATWSRFRWKGILTGVILGILLVLALPQGRKTLRRFQRWDNADYSRLSIWKYDYEVWKRHPWLGIGPKMFPSTMSESWDEYRPLAEKVGLDITTRIPQHPHNVYFESLVERGMLGFASFLALVAFSVWQTARCRSNREARAFVLAALSLTLFCGLFDFSFSFRVFSYLLLFFCGLSGTLAAAKSSQSSSGSPP